MDEATNRSTPTGGVTVPMLKFTVIITPNTNGSIPNDWAAGNNNAVNIGIAAAAFMNIPANRSNILTRIIKMTGLDDRFAKVSATVWGTLSMERTHPSSPAVLITNIIIVVDFTERIRTSGI